MPETNVMTLKLDGLEVFPVTLDPDVFDRLPTDDEVAVMSPAWNSPRIVKITSLFESGADA